MAIKEKFGLVGSYICPITAEATGAHPTYSSALIDLGAAVKAYLAIEFSEATLYGDDVSQLELKQFKKGTLNIETLLSDLEIMSKLYGSEYTAAVTSPAAPAQLVDSVDDAVIPCGYGCIQKLRTASAIVYRACWYFKCQPNLGDDNADTKGDSVTFSNNVLDLTVLPDKTGDWRIRADCDTQADALAFIKSCAGITT